MPARRETSRTRTVLAVLAGLTLAACGSESAVTAPTDPAPEALASILYTAIKDEYRAEATYAVVLEDFGPVTPFSNIIGAEVRHSAAIATLYGNRGWTVPTSEWTTTDIPHFETIPEACSAGVVGELANIEVYDNLLAQSGLPGDVLRVFGSNRSASLDRHLPAFQRCSL